MQSIGLMLSKISGECSISNSYCYGHHQRQYTLTGKMHSTAQTCVTEFKLNIQHRLNKLATEYNKFRDSQNWPSSHKISRFVYFQKDAKAGAYLGGGAIGPRPPQGSKFYFRYRLKPQKSPRTTINFPKIKACPPL